MGVSPVMSTSATSPLGFDFGVRWMAEAAAFRAMAPKRVLQSVKSPLRNRTLRGGTRGMRGGMSRFEILPRLQVASGRQASQNGRPALNPFRQHPVD